MVDGLTGADECRGFILAGEPGVGKSRLVREVLGAVSQRCEPRSVVATRSAGALPLGAFSEWVHGTSANPTVLLRSVIENVTVSRNGRPVIVAVDDAHLLDELSALVVHQLVHRRSARVLLTVRSRQPAPETITALWKDCYLERIELSPLSREESAHLLTRALEGPMEPASAQRLWDLTRGNVLFLRHLVAQEMAQAKLSRKNGTWSWAAEAVGFSQLGELVTAQMGALSGVLTDVVDVLTVAGPLDCDVLTTVVGVSAVDEAQARGLIAIEQEGDRAVVRLAHPLYGEVRRPKTCGGRARALRGRVMSALAAVPVRDRHDLIHRAMLLLESDLPPDPTLFTEAAGTAMALLNPVLAEQLAGAARQSSDSYEATYLHAFALHLIGQAPEAERILANAPDRHYTARERAVLAMFRAANLFWVLGLTDRAVQVLDEAQRRIPAEAHAVLHAYRALTRAATGPAPEAIDGAQKVLSGRVCDVTAMNANYALVLACGYAGRTHDAVDAAKQGYHLIERSVGAAPMVFGFTEHHIQALLLAGYQCEAATLAERWSNQTIDIPVTSTAYSALFTGHVELAAGRVRAARASLEKALKTFTDIGNVKLGNVLSHCDLLVASALCGDQQATDAAARGLSEEANTFDYLNARVALAQAWAAAASGATTAAVLKCRNAAEIARSRGHLAQEVVCLQTATRFGDVAGAPRLSVLCTRVDGPRVIAAAAHAAALADDDPDGLADASRQFERMGDLLAAADVAAQAANAYRRRSHRGSALSASARADMLVAACGGAQTPALCELHSDLLTTRQREILASRNRLLVDVDWVSTSRMWVHNSRLKGTASSSSDTDVFPTSARDKTDFAKANLKDATLRPRSTTLRKSVAEPIWTTVVNLDASYTTCRALPVKMHECRRARGRTGTASTRRSSNSWILPSRCSRSTATTYFRLDQMMGRAVRSPNGSSNHSSVRSQSGSTNLSAS